MKTENVKITPTMAAAWLETVPDFQRKLDPKQVRKILLAIERDEWRENGATIVFNASGQLIDGQHRLKAIAESGRSVWSLVVRNVANGEATFNTIGDDKPRRISDFLRCENATNVAAVARFYWGVVNRQWPPRGHGAAIPPPIADVVKLIKEHVDYIASLREPLKYASRVTGHGSFCMFLVFYYSKVHVVDVERLSEFFARVGDGVGLERHDPALMLRQRFLSLAKGGAIKRPVAQAIILKALHLYLAKQPCALLQFQPEREEFPSLLGLPPAPKQEKPKETPKAKKLKKAAKAVTA